MPSPPWAPQSRPQLGGGHLCSAGTGLARGSRGGHPDRGLGAPCQRGCLPPGLPAASEKALLCPPPHPAPSQGECPRKAGGWVSHLLSAEGASLQASAEVNRAALKATILQQKTINKENGLLWLEGRVRRQTTGRWRGLPDPTPRPTPPGVRDHGTSGSHGNMQASWQREGMHSRRKPA